MILDHTFRCFISNISDEILTKCKKKKKNQKRFSSKVYESLFIDRMNRIWWLQREEQRFRTLDLME